MMQKSGNKVKVMTYSFYEDSFYNQRVGDIVFKEFTYNGIPVLALRHKKIPEDIHHALDNKELSTIASDLISREKPDVVHVGHSKNIAELVKVLKPLNIPYIVTLTDFFLICPKYILVTSSNTLCNGPEGGRACQNLCPELPVSYVIRRLETAREILFSAKKVVSPTKFLSAIFKKELAGIDIVVINYGLGYSRIKKNEKRYLKGDVVRFCYAGSLNPHKGVHILIDAFKKVCSNDASLIIYGSGPNDSYVSHLMAMAKEDRRIEFCGVYSEDRIGEILGNVDVVITPSLWHENSPFVLREALACNVPVIGSEAGGIAENIKDGVNGLLFRMGDSQHLKEVLQMVADNPAMLNMLKHNINGMMIPRVDQEAYAYERVYRQVRDPRYVST
jgi:glycosyltransferase involved in cell wall biosynthesis